MTLTVTSLAPPHIRTRYLRGGCWALAHELSKYLRLPVWGIYEGDASGDCHHAFVADPEREMGYDIRGGLPFAEMAQGSSVALPCLAPLPAERMLSIIGSFDLAELREARRVIRTMIRVTEIDTDDPAPEP